MEVIRECIKETKLIRFEGNNYAEEWQKEAKKRGLPILSTSVEALEILNTAKRVEFLVRNKVLSTQEIASRYQVAVERYVKSVEIEMNTLKEMITQYVIPAVETQLSRSLSLNGQLRTSKEVHGARVVELEKTLKDLLTELQKLEGAMEKLHKKESEEAKMKMLAFEVLPIAGELRKAADTAELLIADELWPLPKYREMLFANTIS